VAADAAETRDAAEVAAEQAATAYDDARARVSALQDELRDVQERLSQAEHGRDASRAERDRTTKAGQTAERVAERARVAVADLEGRLGALSR
jgi:hypothetical protein